MKIALILNDDFSMWHFRKGLISTLVRTGIDVYAITPDGPYVDKIKSLGAHHIPVTMYRFYSSFEDIKLFMNLYNIFRREKFDIVHTMTIKPNIYGSIAAKLAGIKRVVGLVSGLGYIFSNANGLKPKILKIITCKIYSLANKFSDKIWFQNIDDLSYFVEKKLVSSGKALLIKSGGINLEEYSNEFLNKRLLENLRNELEMKKSTKLCSMIVARLVWSKGIKEFVEASEILYKYYDWKFILVGPFEEDAPESVPEQYLKEKRSKNLKILGHFRTDIKELIALSDIVVLPSYYGEGVPRVLLEAMAIGKPIITTNSVGCRETVENGKNGYFVPPRDPKALADAIEALINNDKKRAQFGSYSRSKVEREFDEKIVVKRIIKELYQL